MALGQQHCGEVAADGTDGTGRSVTRIGLSGTDFIIIPLA
jgi:hypothetical protein